MILNVNLGAFGGPLRNGDLLAVCNAVEFLRQKDSEHIMFHMKQDSISQEDYVRKMYEFLLKNTDFFSIEPGTEDLKWKRINLWDFRAISGDLATIKNKEKTQKKTDESQCLDTVGAICLDSKGNLASAISSGGILLKVKVFHYFIIFYEIFRIFFVSIQAA